MIYAPGVYDQGWEGIAFAVKGNTGKTMSKCNDTVYDFTATFNSNSVVFTAPQYLTTKDTSSIPNTFVCIM